MDSLFAIGLPIAAVLFLWGLGLRGGRVGGFAEVFQRRAGMLLTLELAALAAMFLFTALLLPLAVWWIAPWQLFSLSRWQAPAVPVFVVSFLLVDLVYYGIHRAYHRVQGLWRLHRLHHTARQVDALTTWLHHPLELLLTSFVAVAMFLLCDMPVVVLYVYGLLAGMHAAWTHHAVLVSERVDAVLRY
ncbi:sterol desaturase family protein, partial [Leptospira sp. SA-E8]|uniref:sterol desaturase family protein n=1 Tax=Leptospira sp. SA-E8 TaxID=3422259 RepID=UPI003EB84CEA